MNIRKRDVFENNIDEMEESNEQKKVISRNDLKKLKMSNFTAPKDYKKEKKL